MNLVEIPGTLGFKVSDDGKVFDPEGKERNTYVNGDGYITASVKTTKGRWVTYGVHRLLALAHIDCPGDPKDYEVNHIDKDITRNVKDNLEWVLSIHNNSHAALLGKRHRPLILGESESGEKRFFDNIQHTAEVIGGEHKDIWLAIKEGHDHNGWRLQHHRFNDAKPEVLKKDTIKARGVGGRPPEVPVMVRDLDTGDVFEFPTMNDCARYLKVSASHVHQCLNVPYEPLSLLKKRFILARKDVGLPSPGPEEIDAALTRGSREVIAYNTQKKSYFIYPTAKAFYSENGLSKKAVTTALRVDRLRKIDNWLFLYTNGRNMARLKQYLESPVSKK